jgi:hypothetical protein
LQSCTSNPCQGIGYHLMRSSFTKSPMVISVP